MRILFAIAALSLGLSTSVLATPAMAQVNERANALAVCSAAETSVDVCNLAVQAYIVTLDPMAAGYDNTLIAFVTELAGAVGDATRDTISVAMATIAAAMTDTTRGTAVAALASDIGAGVPIDPQVVASLASAT
jgi:hypothetical protein